MPLQSSWVERWLDEYCEPGEHEFRAYRPGAMVCSLCAKEELLRGGTCLICGVEGEMPFALVSAVMPVDRYSGKLCQRCSSEFATRHTIRGWRLEDDDRAMAAVS